MGNLFSFIFLTFSSFSFIFLKTEKAVHGGGGVHSGGITSRKQGLGHRAVFTLAPVQSRTGTHGGIRPGS